VRSERVAPTGGRVLRRPAQRKGMVQMRLCTPDGTLDDRIVSKRQGDDYRLARDMAWGDLYAPGTYA
jgi:ribosomal protein RSM22 (predicted rRNA methylase)